MTNRSLLCLVLGLLSVAFLCLSPGCGYAKRIDPPVFTFESERELTLAASLHARDVGGFVTLPAANTHSMEPLIYGGDRFVIASKENAPYGERLKGRVVGGHPNWNPALFEVHRVQLIDSYGLMVEGDNVDGQHPESSSRITEANYVGEVVGIYRIKR